MSFEFGAGAGRHKFVQHGGVGKFHGIAVSIFAETYSIEDGKDDRAAAGGE